MIVRLLIARTQLHRARQVRKRVFKQLVLSQQYSQVKVGLEVVRIVSELALEDGFGFFSIPHSHQRPAIPGAQRGQFGIQFQRAFEFFDGPVTIVSQ